MSAGSTTTLTENPALLTFSADTTITAQFEAMAPLTITFDGGGSSTIAGCERPPSGTLTQYHLPGASLSFLLQVVFSEGTFYSGWCLIQQRQGK